MNRFLKLKMGLTDSGVAAVKKAAVLSFLVNVLYMGLAMVAMYFGSNVLGNVFKPVWFYAAVIASLMVMLYIVLDMEYVKTYNATYEESANLRFEIADKLRKLPLSYFSRHDLSDLAQTIMQDVADIEQAMSHAMPRCIAYIFFLVCMGIVLLVSNVYLGLATLVPLVVGFALMFLSRNIQRRLTTTYFWKSREMSETFQETIELQKEIKSCGIEEENFKKTADDFNRAEKVRLKTEIGQAVPILLSVMIMKLSLGTITLVAAALLRANAVQLIYVIGFLIASVRLVDAVGALEEYFAQIFYLDARVKRLNEVRETPTQPGKEVELKKFDIELDNVSFAYRDGCKVIDGVGFVAPQNQVTAIVGPSGCGKSTILRLISRLYDYDGGKIIIDGHDIRKVSTDSLFGNISFVFQDVILFNESILENIRIGRKDATDAEVKKAAKLANCDDFIKKLPDGYNTMIGENGSNLSGGERQRISIARAFLKNAPILLLDEISSSLDVENEIKIQESLNRLTKGKTVIIVSHRLKSIEKVDRIVVMDRGKVDSIGTHTQLLEKSALYRKLIDRSRMTEQFVY